MLSRSIFIVPFVAGHLPRGSGQRGGCAAPIHFYRTLRCGTLSRDRPMVTGQASGVLHAGPWKHLPPLPSVNLVRKLTGQSEPQPKLMQTISNPEHTYGAKLGSSHFLMRSPSASMTFWTRLGRPLQRPSTSKAQSMSPETLSKLVQRLASRWNNSG